MQQRSTGGPDSPASPRPVGEATASLPAGERPAEELREANQENPGEKTVRIPVGEETVRIPVAGKTAAEAAEAPAATQAAAPEDAAEKFAEMVAAKVDDRVHGHAGETATPIPIGDNLVRIPLSPDDESATRVLPAPVITVGGPVTRVAVEQAPASDARPGFAVLGVLVSMTGVAAQLVPHGGLRVVLLLVLVLFGPGAALMSFAGVRDRVAAWALTVAGSLSVTCGAAVLTLWTHLWQPAATLGVLTGGTLLACGAQLVRLARAGVRWNPRVPLELGGDRGAGGRVSSVLPFAALAASIALWIVAVARLRPSGVDAYGFTSSLGVPFVAAAALLAAGFAVELFGRARPAVLTTIVLAVPVFMQATVPFVDGTLEYAWTYKHIGVVDVLRDHGHIVDAGDIYQQWPGFFAVVAMISKVSAVDALSFAAWSSLTFGLINALMVTALLRQFTADRRVVALGVLLTQAAMWVDIGYFSPQAFAYSLMLAFWMIVARWLTASPVPAVPAGRFPRVHQAHAWLVRDMPPREQPSRRTRFWAGVAATGVFAAITVTHQLTPIVTMLPVVVLAVLGVLRPRWLAVVLGLVVAGFVAPRLASVSSQYNIFDFDLLSNASGNAASWNTPQQEFSATVARCLALGLWGAALILLWVDRRRLGRVLAPGLLAFLPIVTLAGGNYGGEAIYRVWAFSLPFTALLIAGPWVDKGRRGVWSTAASAVALLAILLSGLQGLHGQLIVHQVSRTDIRAAEYFYAHAQPGAALVLAAPNFPTKLTADYGSFNRGHVSVDITLVGDPLFAGNLTGSRAIEVERYVAALRYPTSYLVVSRAMEAYTDYFGVEPHGWEASLEQALRESPDWTVFYQDDGVTIFKLIG